MENVEYAVTKGIARVTINRPDVMNAVDERTLQELNQVWERIETDTSLRAVVLTGAGTRAFCAGHDIKASVHASGRDFWLDQDENGFGGIALRRTVPIPVVARVNGVAAGGGFEMVLGCDVVIADRDARMGLSEARIGRVPMSGGIANLLRQIPHHLAMGVLLTGQLLGAPEWHRYGLVNEIAEPGQLDAVVDRWLEAILACSPVSIRAIKQAVNRTGHLGAVEATYLRIPALVAAMDSPEHAEGLAAFLEKRPPSWAIADGEGEKE